MKTFTLYSNAAGEGRIDLPGGPHDGTGETWERVDVEVEGFPRLHDVPGQGVVVAWGGTRGPEAERLPLAAALTAGRAREVGRTQVTGTPRRGEMGRA